MSADARRLIESLRSGIPPEGQQYVDGSFYFQAEARSIIIPTVLMLSRLGKI
ncbi:hypothetical protein [uncultured Nostoc sp.]|uniref:hypothetical protein n=1 Tax=uncultured Nostoc sp. TaxID=340711 RepID=UPI0035CBD703